MTEAPDILRRIGQRRRERLREARSSLAAPGDTSLGPPARMPRESSFRQALRTATGRAIIAEIKLRSPRRGSLPSGFLPEAQAELYARGGAAALSVVVEPDFFSGSYELLARCRRASGLPTLAKDFVVDPLQLEWAREAEAQAVLLIAAMLSRGELRELGARSRQLGLVPLVECHSNSDLRKLAGGDWELVGVNNRDLRTFEVSLQRSIDLLPRLPTRALKIAESGIHTPRDVARLAVAGFDAFLVGDSLLRAADPAAQLHRLVAANEEAE